MAGPPGLLLAVQLQVHVNNEKNQNQATYDHSLNSSDERYCSSCKCMGEGHQKRGKNPRMKNLIAAEAVDIFSQIVKIEVTLPGALIG